MKITSIDLFKADIPLREPFRIAVMELRNAANVYIRINTDSPHVGWGESSPFWKLAGETQAMDLAAAADLARVIKGKDALDLDERMGEIDGFLAHNAQIRAAFDMALHDLLGKAAGMPVYRLLGGMNRALITCITIPIGPAESMAQKAKAKTASRFAIIKLKLGAGADEDIARVRAVREAVGPNITLRVDANQGWDEPTALRILRAIEPLNIEFCEQPVPYWNLAGLKGVKEKSPIPIVADEAVFDPHDALKVVATDAADYINIKIAKAGGIRNATRIAAIADSAGKACMIGCMMESRLGLAATVHFALSQRQFRYFDLDSALLLAADPVVGGFRYDGQQVIATDAPGLGVDVAPEFLKGISCQSI